MRVPESQELSLPFPGGFFSQYLHHRILMGHPVLLSQDIVLYRGQGLRGLGGLVLPALRLLLQYLRTEGVVLWLRYDVFDHLSWKPRSGIEN